MNIKKKGKSNSVLNYAFFHLNTVKECIVIYNHKCFKVYMTCRGARKDFHVA